MPNSTELLGHRPVFHYFNLPGVIARGGTLRLFLYTSGIEFDQATPIEFSAWGAEKQRLMDSGDNPAGHLPYIEIGDWKMAGHVPIMRYMERKMGLYGQNPEEDFILDEVSDEYMTWRANWAGAAFGSGSKEDYNAARGTQYKTFETYYARRSNKATPYLMGGENPRFADIVVFAIMHDDQTKFGKWDLSGYPCLGALFAAMKALPATSKVVSG